MFSIKHCLKMGLHQRPLDFQSNALLLSYLNKHYRIAIVWRINTVMLISELKLRNIKKFDDWNAWVANPKVAIPANDTITKRPDVLIAKFCRNIKFKRNTNTRKRYIIVYSITVAILMFLYIFILNNICICVKYFLHIWILRYTFCFCKLVVYIKNGLQFNLQA